VNWFAYVVRSVSSAASLYAFGFYVLTGLHALHVIGGLVPLGITTAHARRGAYTASSHAGVDFIAMYWHFLGAVWLVLFVVLYLLG
jgi:heme/copper-type cytochrome/quinol oxidase subunit 3